MALHHPRDAVAQFGGGRAGAGPDGAGDVGRAVLELGAAVDQVDLVAVQRAVGFRRDPVVDDGAVLAGAGDGGEALATEALQFGAEGEQLLGGPDFGRGSRGALEPAQEPADRDGVAAVGGPGALLLDGVLAGLRQRAWVGRVDDGGARLPQALAEPGRRPGFVHAHGLAAQCRERGRQRLAALHRDAVAQPRAGRLRDLGLVHEQGHAGVGPDQQEAERERGEVDVTAADVEQPRDGGRVGDDGGVLLGGAQPGGDVVALGRGVLAGEAERVRNGRRERRGRAVEPGGIHRVARDRHHGEAGIGIACDRVRAHQHRVVADAGAGRDRFGQPCRGRLVDEVVALEQRGVGLLLQL